jgi:hypothetical protein
MERPTPAGGNKEMKTEELRQIDEKALSDPKLLSSIEDRLSNLRDVTRGGVGKPAVEDDEVDENDPVEPDEKKAGEDESRQPDSPTLDKKDEGPNLPEAYVRAAMAYGWKKEDVIQSFKDDPDRMLGVLSNIYQTRNKVSSEFAALGRKHTAETTAKNDAAAKPVFTPVDTKRLREQYGDDAGPIIDMLEAQNKSLQEMAALLPTSKAKPEQPFNSAVEESGIEQQIHTFFESDAMKPYEKVYGKLGIGQTHDDLAPGQQQFRWKVLERADQIAGGAHLQGVQITLPEALEMAHLLVTQAYRDQIIMEEIKGKVVKRSKGLTLKPSDSKKKPTEDDPKPGSRTKEQLVEDTQSKLNRLFGG